MNDTETRERTYETEEEASAALRRLIRRGWTVSLLAYDPQRNLYVFDVLAGSAR